MSFSKKDSQNAHLYSNGSDQLSQTCAGWSEPLLSKFDENTVLDGVAPITKNSHDIMIQTSRRLSCTSCPLSWSAWGYKSPPPDWPPEIILSSYTNLPNSSVLLAMMSYIIYQSENKFSSFFLKSLHSGHSGYHSSYM